MEVRLMVHTMQCLANQMQRSFSLDAIMTCTDSRGADAAVAPKVTVTQHLESCKFLFICILPVRRQVDVFIYLCQYQGQA